MAVMAAGSVALALVRARALLMQVGSAAAVGHKQYVGTAGQVLNCSCTLLIIHLPLNLCLVDDIFGVLVGVTLLSLDAPEETPRRLSTLQWVGERVPKKRATQHRTKDTGPQSGSNSTESWEEHNDQICCFAASPAAMKHKREIR